MAVEQSPQSAVAHLNLTLEIPVVDSGSSSLQSSQRSSPVGILDSSSTTPTDTHATSSGGDCVTSTTYASCPSLPMSSQPNPLNVKFAPLPQLAPRKRRSTAPLGMAARSQLVNRRRRNYPQYYQEAPPPEPEYTTPTHDPMWTEEELAQARARQIAAAEKEQKKAEAKAGKGTEEDPFMVFGKMVKGVWKKVAKKDKKGRRTPEGLSGDPEKQQDELGQSEVVVEDEKLDGTDKPERTGSSSSEDEPRSGSEDAVRADTPSSNEETPPQLPPKEDAELPEGKLDIDPALLEALSIPPLPSSLESQAESGVSEEADSVATSASPANPPPNRPVPPCPSPSPTDAQPVAL